MLDVKEIPLTKGKTALVDDEDYELLSKRKWQAHKGNRSNNWYARRITSKNGRILTIIMHRLIMNAPDEMVVDHIDHNGLNNQKANLRLCTKAQNFCNRTKNYNNTSGYKGVSRVRGRKWVAYIGRVSEGHHLGTFEDAKTAAMAYNQAAIKKYGEYAFLNPV